MIHLATARRLRVAEFHTYDETLWNPAYAEITGLRLCYLRRRAEGPDEVTRLRHALAQELKPACQER